MNVRVGAALATVVPLLVIELGSQRTQWLWQNRRLVPQEVIPQGSVEGALQFGFELGTGVRTFLPSALPHAAVLVALFLGGLSAGITVGTAFGIGRALMPLARNSNREPAVWDRTLSRISPLIRRVCAIALIVGASGIGLAETLS